jgi:hypothetical protein
MGAIGFESARELNYNNIRAQQTALFYALLDLAQRERRVNGMFRTGDFPTPEKMPQNVGAMIAAMKGPARYRRAFDWQLRAGDRDDLDTASAAFATLFSSDWPEILEDYLYISRKRKNNRLALAKLQTHLVDEVASVETTLRHYRNKKAELQHLEKWAASQDAGLEADLKLVRREHFLYKAYANVIRSIADGIAWRALGFDRAVMRALCQNRGSQHISAPGTTEELREWAREFDYGKGLAILNSLTNCLTFGDITVVHNDGSVEIIEVKRSKTKSSRTVRQQKEMRELVTFLGAGKGSLEGQVVEVCSLDIVPENGLDILHKLLRQTGSVPGFACARISNAAYVECVDYRVVAKEGREMIDAQRQSLIGEWIERHDDIHPFHTLRSLSFSPNLAPFSIFPFDPAICIDLLTGAKSYRVFLNNSAIAREFEHRGWKVTTTPKQAFEKGAFADEFMTVKKGHFSVSLPPAAFMRMAMELLRPQVLIRQCDMVNKPAPSGFNSEYNLPIYSHEAEIWN